MTWTYQWDARRKPHVHPLATPAGRVLTRVEPDDHPWHRGLWFTIKFVNGENFWEEDPPYGVLRHDGPPDVVEQGRIRSVHGRVQWIRPDRETVVIEEDRRLVHVPLDDDAYALELLTTLRPYVDVVLDRTPFDHWGGYGGLTLRGRADWTDTRLLLDDGSVHDRVTPKRSAWCDLSGRVDGGEAGVAILDHPNNPRHPVPWYGSTRAETYGDDGWSNFLNAAFLWHEPLKVGAGNPLRFAYRVIVHDGTWPAGRVAAAYDDWVG